ncbi:uncharacterized protein B0T15DRAFT_491249 [Chaetomium strumarium]|uniref:Uncharacterized protein n=1 Tax=Chaetomium strumarium TaxID=1170767 RepID=A0AAJ0M4E8_9PEZI|nr:hypothetical protein B0T15DRAFT_491249 [Chaetomium strumarium]
MIETIAVTPVGTILAMALKMIVLQTAGNLNMEIIVGLMLREIIVTGVDLALEQLGPITGETEAARDAVTPATVAAHRALEQSAATALVRDCVSAAETVVALAPGIVTIVTGGTIAAVASGATESLALATERGSASLSVEPPRERGMETG